VALRAAPAHQATELNQAEAEGLERTATSAD